MFPGMMVVHTPPCQHSTVGWSFPTWSGPALSASHQKISSWLHKTDWHSAREIQLIFPSQGRTNRLYMEAPCPLPQLILQHGWQQGGHCSRQGEYKISQLQPRKSETQITETQLNAGTFPFYKTNCFQKSGITSLGLSKDFSNILGQPGAQMNYFASLIGKYSLHTVSTTYKKANGEICTIFTQRYVQMINI